MGTLDLKSAIWGVKPMHMCFLKISAGHKQGHRGGEEKGKSQAPGRPSISFLSTESESRWELVTVIGPMAPPKGS